MRINHISVLLIGLSLILISCKPKLDDKIDVDNYKEDLKSLVNKNEYLDILTAFGKKKHISPTEYNEMISFLSNKDSLKLVKDFAYFNILFRLKYYVKIRKKIEEQKKKEELAKIVYQTNNITIYFRDTQKEVEKKIKIDVDSSDYNNNFYIRRGEKDYRIFLGDCEPYFAYSNGYGDNKERLDYFSITLDIHSASTYKDYYVGTTIDAYEQIINYFENLYGKTNNYYPDLSSYSRGYGSRFTVAEWILGETYIAVDVYEKRELWDKYGYDSYKIKYIVSATVSNYDKNFIGLDND